MVKVITVL